MHRWSFSIITVLVCAAFGGACSSGSSGGPGVGAATGAETACQKLCRRAGEANAACAPSNCADKCESKLPVCDAEFRAKVNCLANTQMLGCETNSGQPVALGDCDAPNKAFSTCIASGVGGAGSGGTSNTGGSGGTTSSGGSGGTGGSGGSTGPCDPTKASCVACGATPCGPSEECCWSGTTPACKPAGTCSALGSSCDGNEDCSGGQCCVSYSIGQDGTASSGEAKCSAGGGSVCCTAAPGTPGCAGDKTVESCVCAQDDYCCTTTWDPQCVSEITKFGCGNCGAGCTFSNSSTGSGSLISSVSCRTGADCAGITGNFSVPYSQCCKSKNFGVGACVSETYAASITQSGGTCN